MKCEKCGNEYPSAGYFAVPGICDECFKKLSQEEQTALIEHANSYSDYMDGETIGRRVGFWKRTLAMLIDGVILYALQVVISMSSGLYDAQSRLSERITEMGTGGTITQIAEMSQQLALQIQSEFYWTLLFIQVIYVMYFSLELMVGATLGKLICGIQIADKDGKPATRIQLIKRFIFKDSYLIMSLFASLLLVDYLQYAYITLAIIVCISCLYVATNNKMGFHDHWAGTAVYKRSDILDEEQVAEN